MTKPRRFRTARLAAPLFALVLFAACGSSGGSDGAGTTTAAASGSTTTAAASGGASGDAVSIKGFAFNPTPLTVKVGTKVTWTNDDKARHTATSDDDAFDTKSIDIGKTGSFTFTKAGTYKYHCAIHPTMTAEIDVQ